MRFLVQLAAPGHLRMAGAILTELASRGHEVRLAYDSADDGGSAPAVGEATIDGISAVAPLPDARSGRRRSHARDLRLVVDYLRFDATAFRDAPYLRERMEKYVTGRRREIRMIRALKLSRALVVSVRVIERLVPGDRAVRGAIAAHAPDVVLVSPLIARGRNGVRQTETVKACRSLRVPVAVLISSWDHLTSKGVIKSVPDLVLVWNEAQATEARQFHGVPGSRIAVTGAQLFDGWFERQPTSSRTAFLGGLGLEPTRSCILYVGSSPNITPAVTEIPFVERWLKAIRASTEPGIAHANIVIRPHPGTVSDWAGVTFGNLGNVAVTPRVRPSMPFSSRDEALYFDSIHHADAVVGINTSAILESFIQRKPVLTVQDPDFAETQGGTLHYRHLLPASGGALRESCSLEEHITQLAAVVADPEHARPEIERFLRLFLRPHGLDRRATPIVVDALEALGR